MAAGVIYLRPSADISVGHVKTPEDSTSAYLLINEEVSDGATTHIDVQGKGENKTGTATSQFSMSGNLPENPKYTVTGAKCCISAALGADAQTTGYSVTATFTINGATYTAVLDSSMTTDYLLFELDMPEVVFAINEYVSQQGAFPSVTVSVTSVAITTSSGSAQKTYTVLMVSQIYLELSYDAQTDIGVHMKIGGEWKAATQAYRKVDGAWVEITADECKTILQNSFCVPGN